MNPYKEASQLRALIHRANARAAAVTADRDRLLDVITEMWHGTDRFAQESWRNLALRGNDDDGVAAALMWALVDAGIPDDGHDADELAEWREATS